MVRFRPSLALMRETLKVAMEKGQQDPRFETGFLQPGLMCSAWPSPHSGVISPRMGGADAGVGSAECLLNQEQDMQTLISEVVLMILLLSAVVLSGRV